MAHCLYVQLDGFYTAVLASASRACVVHSDGAVIDSCSRARARGVVAGGALSEARSILRETATYHPYVLSDFIASRDRWLDAILPYSSRVQPGWPHEAWIDLSGHPRPVETADAMLRELARVCSLPLVAGLARTRWIARLSGTPLDSRALELGLDGVAPVIDEAGYLAGCSTHSLTPASPLSRERLMFMGHRTIGDVATVPVRVLRSHFGAEAQVIEAAACGRLHDPVVPSYPPESVDERWEGLHAIADEQTLEAVLEMLALRVGTTLAARNRVGEELVLVCEGEEGERHTRRRLMSRLVGDARSVLGLLRTISGSAPLPFAPLAIRVVMLRIRPATVRQGVLELESARSRGETAAETLVQLRAAYGDAALRIASTIPVSRSESVLRVWRETTRWR